MMESRGQKIDEKLLGCEYKFFFPLFDTQKYFLRLLIQTIMTSMCCVMEMSICCCTSWLACLLSSPSYYDDDILTRNCDTVT